MTLDDAEHYTPAQREAIKASYPPHERAARVEGIPSLGSGAIYPVDLEALQVPDFDMTAKLHWPRAYALDVGWRRTAALWGAWDRASDTIYCYSEHYVGETPPPVHADAIKARGAWIPGVIDPASAGANQFDGRALADEYRSLGLDLGFADNTVEAGIAAVWRRMISGRIKVFESCRNLMAELRLYRRDENGKIVKERDHLCDCLRYLVMSGMVRASLQPFEADYEPAPRVVRSGSGRSTGY